MSKNVPQIGIYSNGDIPIAILTKKIVFILTIPILPNLEKNSYHSFLNSPYKQWYNDELNVGEIGYVKSKQDKVF